MRLFCLILTRFSLLTISFALCTQAAALPPDINWSKIETPHFTLVFDSRHNELATVYARGAEQAFANVSPLFSVWPEKTVILMDDSTDIANGAATGVPYPLILAYPVLPTSLDSVSDFGEWSMELLTHEYTHILNFEPATGVMWPLRYIFGSIVRPNILLPRWYSEGLATYLETRYSRHGRLRSPNYSSIVRAMVIDGSLRREDISRINEVSIPEWPGGIRPYLMGALVMDELVRQKGDSIIGDLNQTYSGRIPFFINGPVEDRFGLNYAGLLEQTYTRAEKMVQRQLASINSQTVQHEFALDQAGFFNHSPTISPNGSHLAFIGKVHNVDSLIYIIKRDATGTFVFDAKTRATATGSMITRASWFPDGKSIVHDGIETFDRHYEYSDLWILDVDTKKDRQLTHGLRAYEPVVSPDGQTIVYVQRFPGSTGLSAINADGSRQVNLYVPPLQTRISRPEFLKTNEVIFSERRTDGEEVLKVLKLKKGNDGTLAADGTPQTVLAEFKPAHYPRATKEGLLFVSDTSGAPNLYLADKKLKTARAVTNTTTRIMTGDLDPLTGDLYYSKLLGKGQRIHKSPRVSWNAMPPKPPTVEPLLDTKWPEYKPQTSLADMKTTAEEYSPWWYLLPRYWIPYMYLVPGASLFAASTASSDPTGRHTYGVLVAYDSLTNRPSAFGTYTNATTQMPITLTALNSYDYVYSGNYLRQITDLEGVGSFFIPGLSNDWKGAIGWHSSTTAIPGSSLKRDGPEAQLSYSNAKKRGLEISPEKGGSASLTYRHYLPGMSDLEYDVTDLHLSKFLAGWILPERHVVALFANASLAPRLDNPVLGVSTQSSAYQTLPGIRTVVMRGYNTGVFLGRNMYQASFEYRFPLVYSYRGYTTKPFFIQRWHADIFADVVTLDGFSYDYTTKKLNTERLGRMFYGTGLEIKLDTTIAYHLPLQFVFGLYYGTDKRANPAGWFPAISLGM